MSSDLNLTRRWVACFLKARGIDRINERVKLRENQRFEIAMTGRRAALDARRRPDSAVDLSVANEGRVIFGGPRRRLGTLRRILYGEAA
jgi:hypothetical protein